MQKLGERVFECELTMHGRSVKFKTRARNAVEAKERAAKLQAHLSARSDSRGALLTMLGTADAK